MAQIVNTDTDSYSMAEVIACAMARGMKKVDGTVGGLGMAATIPMAGVRLATMTVAPNLSWWCGGAFNPTFDYLPLTSVDARTMEGAEGICRMQDVVDLGGSAKWGWGYHGGLQVDKYGNCNMLGIGPHEKLKVRGPGSVGTIWAARMKNAYLFTWHHNRNIFVEKVDYITGPGWLRGGESRYETLKERIPGPDRVYSPICIMDFHETSHAMRLVSVHPGYTVSDVVENTGFELILPDNIPQTPPPSEGELFLLRNFIDRGRLLKNFRLTVG